MAEKREDSLLFLLLIGGKFVECYENYLLFAKKRQKKQSFDSLSERFKSKILPYFKNKNIEDITINDYLIWQDEILKFNYSNNYNRNLHFVFSGFLNYCVKYHDLSINVASKVGCFQKKYETYKKDFYNIKEFKQFIKCLDNEIYKQFFNLMYYCGTRPGEAMALRFSDLKNGYISVSKTINSHGTRELSTPKSFSSVRDIKIDNQLNKDLLNLKKHYISKYNVPNFDFYIFGGFRPLSPTTINRYKLMACNKAKIRSITLHQFRHSHATLLIHNGIIINEVSKRLGLVKFQLH